MFVCVRSWYHHIKERHVFDIFELLNLVVPHHPCLRFFQVVVVIEHSEWSWELGRLEEVFYEGVKVVFAPLVQGSAHTPCV